MFFVISSSAFQSTENPKILYSKYLALHYSLKKLLFVRIFFFFMSPYLKKVNNTLRLYNYDG